MFISEKFHESIFSLLTQHHAIALAKKYHANEPNVLTAAQHFSPEKFIRLFVTAHGMKPKGIWLTHTYACYTDSMSGLKHFFLIPMPTNRGPNIRFENRFLMIDDIQTTIERQSIPHTTPFWYFHYNPNREKQPYYSMTLNLSPSCLEKCVLCAGAKTGRVNNGFNGNLPAQATLNKIFTQHPNAPEQLESVAIVTGCFTHFNDMYSHLKDVKTIIKQVASPHTFRILEHSITTEEQFEQIVGELGFEIFITLECFDQNIRNLALNGKVGKKGRDSNEFIQLIKNYTHYLEKRPELGQRLVRVTYLTGLDSLETMEYFLQQLAEINRGLKQTTVIPWLSIFTVYNSGMTNLQQETYGLNFLINAMRLCEKYFDITLLNTQSGGTSDGYARGLY